MLLHAASLFCIVVVAAAVFLFVFFVCFDDSDHILILILNKGLFYLFIYLFFVGKKLWSNTDLLGSLSWVSLFAYANGLLLHVSSLIFWTMQKFANKYKIHVILFIVIDKICPNNLIP